MELGRRAAIVHLHAPNMVATVAALTMGRGPKLLVHWHSDIFGKGMAGRLVSPIEQRLLARADAVVATSDAYAAASAPLRGHLDKVTSIPIGTPDWRDRAGDRVTTLPAVLSDFIAGRKLVLATGRLVPYKGFDVLVRAARHFDPAAAVIIVGTGPLQERLSALIREECVGERVRIVGGQPLEVLNALRRTARVFCLPSVYRSEAFGVVLVEAMTFGLPLVATRLEGSGVSWVNADGISGLNVPVGDPAALAEACNRIVTDDDLHGRLSEGARLRWEKLFREDIMVQHFLRLYDRLSGADGERIGSALPRETAARATKV